MRLDPDRLLWEAAAIAVVLLMALAMLVGLPSR